jgi:hypothetical protein
MNASDLLTVIITAVVSGTAGTLASGGMMRAVGALASARAQRVKHVPVSGAELYHRGVPLDETQLCEALAAMQAELDELAPPAERNEWELRRQYAAINRFSVLAGTYPRAFPIRSNADDAWQWYAENNSRLRHARPLRRIRASGTLGLMAPLAADRPNRVIVVR